MCVVVVFVVRCWPPIACLTQSPCHAIRSRREAWIHIDHVGSNNQSRHHRGSAEHTVHMKDNSKLEDAVFLLGVDYKFTNYSFKYTLMCLN